MAKAVQKAVLFHQRQNEKIAIYNQPKFTILPHGQFSRKALSSYFFISVILYPLV